MSWQIKSKRQPARIIVVEQLAEFRQQAGRPRPPSGDAALQSRLRVARIRVALVARLLRRHDGI